MGILTLIRRTSCSCEYTSIGSRMWDIAMLIGVVHRWVYLFFFNMLWVFIPLYVLYEAYGHMMKAFAVAEGGGRGKKSN